MEFKDYYATLGVDRQASADDIKKAYRKLVRKYHPDLSQEHGADTKTKELNEAYDVLGNPEKRAAYDELGRAQRPGQPFRAPPDWGAETEFAGGADHDFFSDLFGHLGRRHRGASSFDMRGEDIHAAITIDLADAYMGATRQISLRVPQHEGGRIVTRQRTLNVTIPKGVMPGQQLRLAGQGQPGSSGAGDLYLEVQFRDDPRYRVEGIHVYQNVPVTPWEAALGGDIEVATPSGSVNVTVPPGSQGGRKLRLRGRGLPAQPPGDLYLVLEVVLPAPTSEKARDLYRTMAREMAFNPRKQPGV